MRSWSWPKRSANSKPWAPTKAAASPITGHHFKDLAFRGSISIYQGIAVNLFYVVFRVMAAIHYASVWFLSMAVYYLVLGGLRAYLIVCYRRRTPELERRCYHTTAWLLFLLNIPMGGMIVLMVRTDSGFSYPGYIIYLSALYTFYSIISPLCERRSEACRNHRHCCFSCPQTLRHGEGHAL